LRKNIDIPNVVERVTEETIAIRTPEMGDLVSGDETPIGARQTQLLYRVLQSVRAELAARVVPLDLLIAVDDVATVDVGRGVRHGQRTGLESGRTVVDPQR
jgi:hypothetical protein